MTRQLLYPVFILLFLSSCSTQRNLSGSASKEETEQVTKFRVKKIAIVGAGSVASRVFLENLSEQLITTFKQKGVSADFIFLEDAKTELNLQNQALDSSKYDAYLVFLPAGNSSLQLTHKEPVPLPLPVTVHSVVPNSYKQEFTMQAYIKTNDIKLVWQSALDADSDLADKRVYKLLSGKIMNVLSENIFEYSSH